MNRLKNWFYGLASAIVGGAATSLSSAAGTAVVKMFGVDVPNLTPKQVGVIAAAGAFWTSVAYLKQSPLPPMDSGGPQTENQTTKGT